MLVHKIAGAAAEAGESLDTVVQVARQVSKRIGTLGIALGSVTVPGAAEVNDRLDDDNIIEVGLGIHGEAGLKQSPMMTANQMADEMISTILNYGRVDDSASTEEKIIPFFKPGDELCVLVNNLGGTSNFEMSVLARACVEKLESSQCGVKVTRLLVGSYMTSFDMHGVSLTLLNLTPELLALLDAPTSALAWSKVNRLDPGAESSRPSFSHLPNPLADGVSQNKPPTPPLEIADFSATSAAKLTKACESLALAEPLLTKYDTIVGDGDCGITMKRGATEVLNRLRCGSLDTSHPVTLFNALAEAVSVSMGGTSGALLELMFRNMSSNLSRSPGPLTSLDVAKAFESGVKALTKYGGATVGSRTMMDALVPAASELAAGQGIPVAASKARKGAEGTASMTSASAGRSNYLSEETLHGTPDPGAIAVAIILESIVESG